MTLLDLRTAFGEVSHDLISKALAMHKIPQHIIDLISNIYQSANVAISVNNNITDPIRVRRGVLQGDPCSPLLFNICFNILIRTIAQDKFKTLGFAWGPSTNPCATSWLQFADDSALISHDCKSAQSLVDITAAWCKWSNMFLRPEKCVTFGMAKIKGVYDQFEPKLYIEGMQIPSVKTGASFKYLGKLFSFSLDNLEIKEQLITKLNSLVEKISNLKISIQTKLKIVRHYIPSQLNFELRLYSLSHTWIINELDSIITKKIQTWLQYPINTCVAEIAQLPLSHGGLGIPSLKTISEKQRLSVRSGLRDNSDPSIQLLWTETSSKNIPIDSLLNNSNYLDARRTLNQQSISRSLNHVNSLETQGPLISAINTELKKQEIKRWSNFTLALPEGVFKFARKALQQQLATAANMKRWGRSADNVCTLCKSVQTNKHVLSNCSSPGPLSRYSKRHNSVLTILVEYLTSVLPSSNTLYVDLPHRTPISTIFHTLRPDLVVHHNNKIMVLELTVCHETNFTAARERKISKYCNLKNYLVPPFLSQNLIFSTVEVSVLGFIADLNPLCKLLNL